MEVVIPAAFFLNKVPPVYVSGPTPRLGRAGTPLTSVVLPFQVWDLHLNDPECRGVQVGDDYVFSVRTNLSDCGTITVRRSHLQEGRVGGGGVHQTLHVNVDATNRADISVYGDEDKPPLPAINYPFYGVVGILRPARMSCLFEEKKR